MDIEGERPEPEDLGVERPDSDDGTCWVISIGPGVEVAELPLQGVEQRPPRFAMMIGIESENWVVLKRRIVDQEFKMGSWVLES